MARTLTISQKELKRAAAAAYETKAIRVLLANVGNSGYTEESTVANWQSVELASANGYARFSGTVGTGSYDGTAAAYVMPDIDATFTASSAGFTFDRVIVYFNGETYIHSMVAESPAVVLLAGQSQTYRISLRTDD
jgi:hypothetical protein